MNATPILAVRSVFFVPGDRADMIAKIPRWMPDVAVVDLEDAVADADKESARRVAVAAIADLQHPTVFLRVNAAGSPWHTDDVAAAAAAGIAGIVLPKLERLADLDTARRCDLPVLGGLETARGVAEARLLCEQGGLVAAYFGAEDFIADMGGHRTTGSTARPGAWKYCTHVVRCAWRPDWPGCRRSIRPWWPSTRTRLSGPTPSKGGRWATSARSRSTLPRLPWRTPRSTRPNRRSRTLGPC